MSLVYQAVYSLLIFSLYSWNPEETIIDWNLISPPPAHDFCEGLYLDIIDLRLKKI